MAIETDLQHVIHALSDALDLVGIDDVGHGKRVGIMAAECVRAQGGTPAEVQFMFDLGVLHDIGVSSTQVHRNLVREFDWAGSQQHCVTGAALLRDFAPFADLAAPVRYHHSRWESLRGQRIDPQVSRQANLILLVDRVDVMLAPYYADNAMFDHLSEIRANVQAHVGSYFAPDVVEEFLSASESEAFWLQLQPHALQSYLNDMQHVRPACPTDINQLRQLAKIFARIVDAKSAFTAEHSAGVARLARYFGETLGISEDHCDKLEIAGLLHDLGKLRVPDEILDKPGRLDEHERRIMGMHSFETYQILRNIRGFEEITPWAAYHHEAPGGRGYPFHLRGETLPLEARILRVADIAQAMAQDRPYRSALGPQDLSAFLDSLAYRGEIDAEVARVALSDIGAVLQAAQVPA